MAATTARDYVSPMTHLARLETHLGLCGRVLLGYSGGVDSALLAVVATRVLGPVQFLAAIGRSASYPEAQWRVASELAARFGIPLLEVDTHELADPRYLANPPTDAISASPSSGACSGPSRRNVDSTS
jgi:uncharacterized protein